MPGLTGYLADMHSAAASFDAWELAEGRTPVSREWANWLQRSGVRRQERVGPDFSDPNTPYDAEVVTRRITEGRCIICGTPAGGSDYCRRHVAPGR